MGYNEANYVKARAELDNAVWVLLENGTSEDDIHGMIDQAVENYEPEGE